MTPIGLCSVTFRRLSAAETLQAATAAGLDVIEWGSDVHAPPGELERLRELRETTNAAGLRVCSYGSYFEAGTGRDDELPPLVAAAVALGAPRIRIWPGVVPSAQAGADERAAVVASVRSAADLAGEHGIAIALEYHDGSLTDDPASALALLDEVDRANVTTYWQPPHGLDDDAALTDFAAVEPRVSAVHAFAWKDGVRYPLASREALWRGVAAALGERELLIEFVPDDDPAVLPGEAAALAAAVRSAR